MRIRKLLMSVMVLCFCSFMTVQAEGEQDEFLPEFNIETETVVETSIDSISDISINFTKGSIYRYTGVAVTPEVSSITYVNENGETKEITEGFEVTYKEDSNNIEIGKANVWLTIDGYTGEKCIEEAFSIVLARVWTFNADAVTQKEIVLSWEASSMANGYEIYRSTEEGTRGKIYETITSGDTVVFSDTDVEVGESYYYTIKAYRDDVERHYSANSEQISKRTKLKSTKIAAAKWKNYNTIELEWNKLNLADGYKVYRSASKNGEYKRVATVKGVNTLNYKDTVPTCGKTYYYKVCGYVDRDDKKLNGKYSEIVSRKTKPAKTKFTDNTSSKAESITLRWKESKGAKGYEIYRSTKKNGEYSLVKTVKSADTLKWTNKELDAEIAYCYKIRPYTEVNDTKVYGKYSDAFEKALIPKEIEEITEYTYVSYRSGGTSPNGWDCSGFTQWVYKNIYGISIPRSSREQAKIGTSINKNDMSKWKPGDILVYAAGGSVNHVGLYLGNGKMMHALNTKYDTVIQDVEYYESWDSRNNLKSVRRCL